MTETHPPTRGALACVLMAAVVAYAPQTARAAPAKPSPVESYMAEAIKAFEAGAEQEAQGDRQAAAHHYRAAAEANASALKALDRSSAEHLAHAQTLAKRVAKAYGAGLLVVDDPDLRQAAWAWCTDMASTFDVTGDPGFVDVEKNCAQWQPPPVPVTPVMTEKPPPLPSSPPVSEDAPNLRKLQIGLGISGAATGVLLGTSLGVALSRPDRFERLGVGLTTGFLALGGAIATTIYAVHFHRAKRAQSDRLRVAVSWQPGGLGLVAQGKF